MERLSRLKRKCLLDAAIFGTIALLMSGVASFSFWYTSTSAEDLQKLRTEKSGLDSSKDQIANDLKAAEHAIILYNVIKKNDPEEKFSLNREDLLKKLGEWQETLFLNSLKANIDPVETKPLDGVTLELRKHKTMQSNVKLEIEGVLDTHVWQLLERVRAKTHGFADINTFKLERSCNLSRDILVALARGQKLTCVKSNIDFRWIGLEEIPEPKAPEGAEAAAPPGGVEP